MAVLTSKRSWMIAAGVVFALGAIATLLAVFLFFGHVHSHGSDCGTILSPKEPLPTDPNPLLADCGGSRFVNGLFAVVCAVLAVACVMVGLLLRRRGERVST